MARNGLLRRRPRPRDTVEDTLDLADRRNDGFVKQYDQTPTEPWPGGIWPSDEPAPPPRARVSFWATLGLILSLVALCATLTGLLAPEGLGLALIGLLASIFGLAAVSRPGIAGRSLAILGVLAALAAAGLAVAAFTGHLGWLNNHTDAVPRWRAWLVARWPWLDGW